MAPAENQSRVSDIKFGFFLSIIVFCLFAGYMAIEIHRSKLSMAVPGGIAEIILVGIPLGLVSLPIGWAISRIFRKRDTKSGNRSGLPSLILAIGFLVAAAFSGTYLYLSRNYGRIAIELSSEEEIRAFSEGTWVKMDSSVQRMLALNKNCPTDILFDLSKSKNSGVRSAVARNRNTPPETLLELAKDREMQFSVAGNPNTPAGRLRELFKENRGTHRSLADNPAAPPEIQLQLAKEGDLFDKQSLVGNPGVTKEALEILATDSAKHISRDANNQLRRRFR